MESERSKLTSNDDVAAVARERRRSERREIASEVRASVTEIVSDVATRGDLALNHWVSKLDADVGVAGTRAVAPKLQDQALADLDQKLVDALAVAVENARSVADQLAETQSRSLELAAGQSVTIRPVPVQTAAVYVPGGRNPFPSSLIMGVTAAQAAGVESVVACARPQADSGEIHNTILATAALLKVDKLFRMGGPQAIAAFAFGTESVPKADVIVGPGNEYVVEAKRQVLSETGIDSLAGPSELMVVVSEGLNSDELSSIALDLGAQAEHGPLSPVLVLSNSSSTLDQLAEELSKLDAPATDRPVELVELPGYDACAEFVNTYAPEHLQLAGAEAQALAPRIRAAGCVFVGAAAGTAFGDYVAGSNHVLPTAGAARYSSALSPQTFIRHQEVVEISPDAAAKLADAGAAIAQAEGFDLHRQSMLARKRENEEQ